MAPGDEIVPQSVPTAARERAVEILTRHFATDALTEDALEARLQRVYAARTQQELNAVFADLPALRTTGQVPTSRKPPRSEIRAVLSGNERTISGVVPSEMKLRARLGYIELDLTQATFQPGVTTIDVRAFMGYVQLRLPAGVHVENDGRALFGFFAFQHAPETGDGPAVAQPTVRILGRALFGFAQGFQHAAKPPP